MSFYVPLRKRTRVSHDGITAEDATLGVDASLAISRDLEGGWVRGHVTGRILAPSADWTALDGRIAIETEHETIYYI
jgi:hypothetical protein